MASFRPMLALLAKKTMLDIVIPSVEYYDEEKNLFVRPFEKDCHLRLEHSLVSISKWESKWCKPFLTNEQKTLEESIDYIRCMTLTQNVNPDVYQHITNSIMGQINAYIEAPMTATTFMEHGHGGNREVVTSELIYYWMIALNIPFECQKWHINRLLTLINVCNIKNAPEKKMSRSELYNRNRALNEARKLKYKTKG